ncbi:MAG: serpin family protein [Nocardiopsaceae bacterium]|nr:serpin family protein [Nocardiopsaceae bacterium]
MPVSLRPDHLDFALRLHTGLSGSGFGLVWSPYSVASALGLVAVGARGRTREELTGLLGPRPQEQMAALDQAVADGPEPATRTGLWVREDLPLRSEFESAVRARPGSGVYPADFSGDPDGVRQEINAEIATATRGLIGELLQPGTVRASTQALLVNALWVRMRWLREFDSAKTRRRAFHSPAGTRKVPMMRRQARLPYASTAGWRMATLPGDGELALDVLLPDEPASRTELTQEALTALYRAASPTEVALSLPRFELTYGTELSGALHGAGVRTVFTDQADLAGISQRRLRIDQIIHRARLRVDEKGAEGAAATAVVMRTVAAIPGRPVEFTADRPFVFVLRRRAAILFLGTVADPEDPGPP